MGSVGNSDPWAPYDRYKDCTRGICNEFCPQWCYIIFPPPPPTTDGDSGSDFSPLILAVIGTLASAFLLVIYFTVISKYCRRRRGGGRGPSAENNQDGMFSDQTWLVGSAGLTEDLIKSISVYKYKKSGGVVDGTDCSVCLSEFEDGEKLRLLPKCNHAFHLPCIDTWLKSHSSCPLCRFDIGSAKISAPELSEATQGGPPPDITVSALVQPGNRSLLLIHDLESGDVEGEAAVRVEVSDDFPKPTSAGRESVGETIEEVLFRRSFSFDSAREARVANADVINGSEEQSRSMENMRRSISTGRFNIRCAFPS